LFILINLIIYKRSGAKIGCRFITDKLLKQFFEEKYQHFQGFYYLNVLFLLV